MKKLFTFGAAIAIAAVLAACGGSSGSGEATASSSNGESTVSVAEIGEAGSVLVDSSGRALYASDQESETGMVLCTGACNSFWEPLMASGGAAMGGPAAAQLGTIKRPEGGQQVTYEGKPLYTFTQEGPEEVTGDGFKDAFEGTQFTWHVVSTGSTGSSEGSTSESGGGAGGYGY